MPVTQIKLLCNLILSWCMPWLQLVSTNFSISLTSRQQNMNIHLNLHGLCIVYFLAWCVSITMTQRHLSVLWILPLGGYTTVAAYFIFSNSMVACCKLVRSVYCTSALCTEYSNYIQHFVKCEVHNRVHCIGELCIP